MIWCAKAFCKNTARIPGDPDEGECALYLKRLEMVGFKSFAERTRLDFEPGMMAIVGPNGCGKSNIADAVRWVLGEQSAKALRGSKMEDVIFNGTDASKAMGMAEVSLTLADCEASLGTEYHEVTVTRRVFRSGEGQYLINKTPCRLKDIQRLFMDTGIGTNSYSLMEQGRIDRVLSSRPEDRRAVFEEASGITKFKADKKEAMRKLEHTEQNLLRLADIIREVKRQIISLQRQAGKARRYKELQERLRAFDLYFTRDRLAVLDAEIGTLDARRAALAEREEALGADVTGHEQRLDAARADLATVDHEIEETREAAAQVRSEWGRAQETIRTNGERIVEYRGFSQRDSREEADARRRVEELQAELTSLADELDRAAAAQAEAERVLGGHTAALKAREDEIESVSQLLHRMRSELLELENLSAGLTHELTELESRDRGAQIRREKLAAEQQEQTRRAEQAAARDAAMAAQAQTGQAETARVAEAYEALRRRRAGETARENEVRARLSDLRSRLSARRAQVEMLHRSEAQSEGFPGGARLLLDASAPLGVDRAAVLGSLAHHLRAEAGYQDCLQAVLRPWLDALVVSGETAALDLLRELERQRAGSARLLSGSSGAPPPALPEGLDPLLAHVRIADGAASLVRRLLGTVAVIEDLSRLPAPRPAGVVFVTRAGHVVGDGFFEFWMPESRGANPVARRQILIDWEAEIGTLQSSLADAEAEAGRLEMTEKELDAAIEQTRLALEQARQAEGILEGERISLARDLKQTRERLETVGFELQSLISQGALGQERRVQIQREQDEARVRQGELRAHLATRTDEQRTLEQQRSALLHEVTEARIAAGDRRRDVEDLRRRRQTHESRLSELSTLIRERAQGIQTYLARIEELERSTAAARDSLQPLDDEIHLHESRLDALRRRHDEQARDLAAIDQALRGHRAALDETRRARGEVDIELAQQRMRRQNTVERAAADYHVSPDQIAAAAEPDWGEAGRPADRDALEALIAELRARLESMGPVNLVAIEEYQEHEKRHEFLTQQQDDLVRAKQQLIDMIRRINQTTTQMFAETFAKVNENFREMFTKLFGGGTARLVMVDEGDVLESGIEIIARPPGKKLQSVSLLSGGERTMTAVALLFALYMVKPSPFCLLDELDAALDDTNIGRFIAVVKNFLERSQFLVITHNRQTIASSNVLYGVTMEKMGVSKIVSVKFHREGRTEYGGAHATTVTTTTPAPAAAPAADGAPGVSADATIAAKASAGAAGAAAPHQPSAAAPSETADTSSKSQNSQ